jgi:uroporphyrinogen-III synthase
MTFEGLRVLSLETRRAREMETLIRRYHGEPFIAPSVRERAIDNNEHVFAWADRLLAGEFDMAIFMTGVGLGYLRDAVLTRIPKDSFAEALGRLTIVSRGPKPAAVLRELGVKIDVLIPEPNTWREIVEAVRERPEQRITVQEYGKPNLDFERDLRAMGKSVNTVFIYRWEMPDDPSGLREAVRRIATRRCDVVLFTTSIQLAHLLQVASEMGLAAEVRQALAGDIAVASVGPVMTAALEEHNLRPDIVPPHPKMGVLVKVAAEEAAAVLTRKRASRPEPAPSAAR